MGDNKAVVYEERLHREEQAKVGYWCKRFGHQANVDDPLWDAWDNDKISPLHNNRSPFSLHQPTYGLGALRRQRAGIEPISSSAPASPAKIPIASPTPPQSSPARALTGLVRSSTAGSAKDFLEEVARPPATNGGAASIASRGLRSVRSDGELLPVASPALGARQQTGYQSQASRRSLRSKVSVASLRSKIGEAVQQEVQRSELELDAQQNKNRCQADLQRTAGMSEMDAYHAAKKWKEQRARTKNLEMPVHLRTGTSIIDSGCKTNYTTTQMRSLNLPVQMATDPKWSVDIKRMNNKIGLRVNWERKIAGAITGQMIPEMKYMPPRPFVTNPPTPYFVPGEAHIDRAK